MNFFEQQHQARQRTRMLVVLFVLAVTAIVLAVNGAAALIWRATHHTLATAAGQIDPYPRYFFLTNTVLTVGLIVAGTLIELFNLKDGGDVVAEMVGGQLVSRATHDFNERRLLNVVDEMALAAHLTCPRVYVLPREEAINAFAAGYNPNDAVVAVTQGALTRLTRDELQGVVAHEFSHILNGDMRLNSRLIGVLFGIQMMAGFGEILMRWGSIGDGRSDNGGKDRDNKVTSVQMVFFAIGLTLFVVGYIGIFFGRLIKAAVSREREFLADASAVQFTRNADGIGGALQKIGGMSDPSQHDQLGSRIRHANAEQLSHLFLGAVKPSLVDGLFATHPPIAERLRRIFGRNVELLEAPVLTHSNVPAPMLPDLPYVPYLQNGPQSPSILSAPSGITAVNAVTSPPPIFSAKLDAALHDPYAARALAYALVLEVDQPQPLQMSLLEGCTPPQAATVCELAQQIAALPVNARLPLLDLAIPALTQLALPERAQLLSMINRLIAADNRITLREFVLQTLLVRRLDPRAGRLVAVRYDALAALRSDCVLVLSLIARVSHSDTPPVSRAVADAFAQGIAACVDLRLSTDDLLPTAQLDFGQISQALDRLAQLAPLAKPALIKALVATARQSADTETISPASADIVRAICSAIDAPLPSIVAAHYRDYQKIAT